MFSTIRWGRVIIGGVLSEAGVIAVLLISITFYTKVIAPVISDAEKQRLGERVGYYVAPTAGFVTTMLAALWAARGLDSDFIANGLMVGVISVAISVPFFVTARPEHRLMYGVAFALRFAAGYVGGTLARV
jgi:hypothetical protein